MKGIIYRPESPLKIGFVKGNQIRSRRVREINEDTEHERKALEEMSNELNQKELKLRVAALRQCLSASTNEATSVGSPIDCACSKTQQYSTHSVQAQYQVGTRPPHRPNTQA